MITESIFKGTRAVLMENDSLKVIILPEIGGKVASLYKKSKDFELLFQNKSDTYRKAEVYSHFGEYDASGFDDAFPAINQGLVQVGKEYIEYPDHGEIWAMRFEHHIKAEALVLQGSSSILSYRYAKTLELKEDCLVIRYHISNSGAVGIPCLWAMHCLIRCEEDMQLLFPQKTQEVRNVHKKGSLGEVDRIHPFPKTTAEDGKEYILDRIYPATAEKCEKYYVEGALTEGVCGVYYPGKDVTYKVYFDKDKLPYLGFWITEGGFRGDYNCAMEPANGFYDSIETAQKNNALFILEAGAALDFELKLELK